MYSTRPCTYCEMAFVEFESDRVLTDLLDAPNTYDRSRRTYLWVETHTLKYLLIPRSVQNSTIHAELYLCVDEDDLKDLNLSDFLRTLIEQEVLLRWPSFRVADVIPALVSAKPDAQCWRFVEGNAGRSEEKH